MKGMRTAEGLLGLERGILGFAAALGLFALSAAGVKKVFSKEKPDAKKQG